jgi:hypothetical protein
MAAGGLASAEGFVPTAEKVLKEAYRGGQRMMAGDVIAQPVWLSDGPDSAASAAAE